MNLSVAALLLLLLAGCVSIQSTMEPWLGRQESELIANWGTPDESADGFNGTRVLTWISYLGEYGGVICRKRFTIDESGEILGVDWEGCPNSITRN